MKCNLCLGSLPLFKISPCLFVEAAAGGSETNGEIGRLRRHFFAVDVQCAAGNTAAGIRQRTAESTAALSGHKLT